MSNELRKLALDALHNTGNSSPSNTNSCFVFNEAGSKLLGCDESVLPILEETIRSVIAPAMNEYRERYGIPDWDAVAQEGRPFAGLTELVGAYWVICARSDPNRAVEFVMDLPRPASNEAISILAVYFHRSRSLSDVAMPKAYVELLFKLSCSEVSEFKDVSKYVMKRLGLSKKPVAETAGQ
jgi:hypothetical protein